MPGMSPRMKLKKGRPLVGHPNVDPTVSILTFTAAPVVDVEDLNGFTGEAADAEQGDLSAGIEWFIRTVTAAAATGGFQNVNVGGPGGGDATGLDPDTAGTQGIDLGGAAVGGNASGLANDATVYTATVDVDGAEAPQAISIVGSASQTFQTVIDELNADTTGAVWSLGGNGLVCTSNSTGAASSINILDVDLFSTLNGFSSVEIAVNGTTTLYTATITIDGNAPTAIAITGDDALTFGDLVTELNAIANPAGANWSLGVADDLQADSQGPAGASSTILIVDTDLFSSLNNFAQIDAAVDGVDEIVELIEVGGNGAAPALTFPTLGNQDVVASITDGFGVTITDTQAINVASP